MAITKYMCGGNGRFLGNGPMAIFLLSLIDFFPSDIYIAYLARHCDGNLMVGGVVALPPTSSRLDCNV